jgi:hypothetical protein
MADQNPPAGEDTSGVGGPEGTAAEQVDWQARALEWEDRYGNIQPEYTRATQEAAALRERDQWHELLVTSEDPDIRRQAAEALGYEFEEEQAQHPDDLEDPLEPLNQRLARLEAQTQQRTDQESENDYALAVRAVLDERLDELMPDAGQEDQDWVLAYAINALPVAADGLPDIGQAHELWAAREEAKQKAWEQAWAESKRAPFFAPNGQTATEVPNLDNDQERQDYMTRRLMANEQT